MITKDSRTLEHFLVFANPGSMFLSREAGEVQVPDGLAWMRDVPGTAVWLDALPAIVDDVPSRSRLEVGHPFDGASVSRVAHAPRGGDEGGWYLGARDAGISGGGADGVVLRYVRRPGSLTPDTGAGLLRGLRATIDRRRAQA